MQRNISPTLIIYAYIIEPVFVGICVQRRFKSVCASTQSNQCLSFTREETFDRWLSGRFMLERIHNTKEQIYFYERAENHNAKERMLKSFK